MTGCASNQINAPGGNVTVDHDLVYAVSLFGDSTVARGKRIIKPEAVLALTPKMRLFANKAVSRRLLPPDRARRLIRVLEKGDFFGENYYTADTLTAREVFEERSGNCLSYTNLFVALARELGLNAYFQMTRLPSVWSAEKGYVVRSRHINVLISDPRTTSADWVTVDFNTVAGSTGYPQTPVSDAIALSSFYNNLAVEKLYAGDFEAAVAYLAQAIEVEPNNTDAWVNLAAVYSRHNKLDEMQAAFEAALRAEPGNESALNGLMRLHKSQGELLKSEYYKNEIRTRRYNDPYYQFARAQAAYDQGAFRQSLQHVNRALELKKRGTFYYLRALVHYTQGDLTLASENLAQAQKRKRSLPVAKQEQATLLASQLNELAASPSALAEVPR